VIRKLAVGGRVRVDFYFLKSHHRQEILHFIESRFKLISCLFYARTSLNYYVENLYSCLREETMEGQNLMETKREEAKEK